jgi:hypothetical protein
LNHWLICWQQHCFFSLFSTTQGRYSPMQVSLRRYCVVPACGACPPPCRCRGGSQWQRWLQRRGWRLSRRGHAVGFGSASPLHRQLFPVTAGDTKRWQSQAGLLEGNKPCRNAHRTHTLVGRRQPDCLGVELPCPVRVRQHTPAGAGHGGVAPSGGGPAAAPLLEHPPVRAPAAAGPLARGLGYR